MHVSIGSPNLVTKLLRPLLDDLENLESQVKELQQENTQLRHSYQVGASQAGMKLLVAVAEYESDPIKFFCS